MLSLFASITLSLIPVVQYAAPVDSFPLPVVPATLTNPSERAEVIVGHFFDGAILPDAASQSLEMAIANFTTVASLASEEARKLAAETLFSHAGTKEKSETLRNTLEQYLFSGDSPYLDLDLFAVFLEADKPSIRRDGLLNLVASNKVGTKATDIPLVTATGERINLSEISVRTPLSLLVFFDPECHNCRELTLSMSGNSSLAEAVKSGRISVITVTPDAEAPEVPDYFPSEWIPAVDSEGAINENDLYYIPSFPEVYLIEGKSFKVLARGLRTPEKIADATGL